MRISDWSSDVCSSDLRRFGFIDQYDHDFAVARHFGPPDKRVIAIQYACLDHRVSRYFQRIMFSTAEQRRRCNGHRVILGRSEEHTSELQSLMRISYAVFCLKKKQKNNKVSQPE